MITLLMEKHPTAARAVNSIFFTWTSSTGNLAGTVATDLRGKH